jgi:hypothetical protein
MLLLLGATLLLSGSAGGCDGHEVTTSECGGARCPAGNVLDDMPASRLPTHNRVCRRAQLKVTKINKLYL